MRPEPLHSRPLTLVAVAVCQRQGFSRWRQIDLNAYKFTRLIAGRRIRGAAWLPRASGGELRLSNAHADVAAEVFLDRTAPIVERAVQAAHDTIVIPVPGPRRIVGSPPSRSRWLAHMLAERAHRRMLDILRWRQVMTSCSGIDAQTFTDNVVLTGSPPRGHCILVADFLSSHAPVQAIAVRLQEYGSQPILAICGGLAVPEVAGDPFETREDRVEPFVPERI